jgi:hypothetical protein
MLRSGALHQKLIVAELLKNIPCRVWNPKVVFTKSRHMLPIPRQINPNTYSTK